MGTVKLRKWDSTEHLKSEEDIVLYFEACLDEADDDATFLKFPYGMSPLVLDDARQYICPLFLVESQDNFDPRQLACSSQQTGQGLG